jgi:hypothetical protein
MIIGAQAVAEIILANSGSLGRRPFDSPFDRREGRADDDIARRLARYSLQRLDLS